MITDKFKKMYNVLDINVIQRMPTRQLLKHLRSTYHWWDYNDWSIEEDCSLIEYQALLRAELATREHIPNKIESKRIRKARIKKGR